MITGSGSDQARRSMPPGWWRQVHPGRVTARASKAAGLWLQRRWQRSPAGGDVRLPFDVDTPLRSYVYTAYPLGILSSHGIGLDDLCVHFIQIVFPDAKLTRAGRHRRHVRFFPIVSAMQLSALGYFTTSEWTTAAIDRPHAVVVKDLIAALHAGRYLLVRANECFLPESRCFLRLDHRHSFLITGYDRQRDVFSGPAYASGGEFTLREVPSAFMAEAIKSRRGGVAGTYSERRQVLEIALARTKERAPEAAQVFARLCDYARGVDNAQKYVDADGPFKPAELRMLPTGAPDREDRQGTFGIRIYESFRRYLTDVIADKDVIDLRATRVLMDHKQVIAAALRILSAARLVDASAIASFAEVTALATQLHHSAFAWNLTRERTAGRAVYDLLHDVQAAERESLAALYARPRETLSCLS